MQVTIQVGFNVMSWSEKIIAAMTHAGMSSQGDLAEAMGVSSQAVSEMLRRETPPRLSTLQKYAEMLKVDPLWLLNGDPDRAPTWASPRPVYRVRESHPGYDFEAKAPGLADPLWPKTKTPPPDTARPDYREGDPSQTALVGTVSAGAGSISYLQRPRAFRNSKRPVMRVVGNSAYPVAYDGQFVMVDLDTPPRHNNLVIIETVEDEDGQPVHRSYLKRYCEDARAPNGYVLASVNSGIDSPYIPHDCILTMRRVVGVIFEE